MAADTTRQSTPTEIAVVGGTGTGLFLGALIYGVKKNHPWIGFVAGLAIAGIVTQALYAAIGSSPYLASPRGQIAVTDQGARAV